MPPHPAGRIFFICHDMTEFLLTFFACSPTSWLSCPLLSGSSYSDHAHEFPFSTRFGEQTSLEKSLTVLMVLPKPLLFSVSFFNPSSFPYASFSFFSFVHTFLCASPHFYSLSFCVQTLWGCPNPFSKRLSSPSTGQALFSLFLPGGPNSASGD